MTEQKKEASSGKDGEARTSDKTIGEVKFARGQDNSPDDIPKVSAAKNSGLRDDHDPGDIGQKTFNKAAAKSQNEGPAAYAPHDQAENKGAK